jgi:TetR/AcrR family transcriptional regulator, copper-responsive repressor
MVQNSEAKSASARASKTETKRKPGRPRAYDPDAALERAFEVFWKKGYNATSLEDLAEATGMNRPSLYAAFGDKHTLYLKALDYYGRLSAAQTGDAFTANIPLREALLRAYDAALTIYFSGKGRPRGCFSVGTATTEAAEDPEIRAALVRGVRRLDKSFETRMRIAAEKGELSAGADPSALAALASGIVHTIAIRARAGVPRAELEELVRKAVAIICGT